MSKLSIECERICATDEQPTENPFKIKEKVCRFNHICTSGCQKDFDCPCQADHCCALTQDCEGNCDDCFNKKKSLLETLEYWVEIKPLELLGQ